MPADPADLADVRPGDRFAAPADAYDVAIVGAGIGGLVAGALLARRGRRVLALDRHTVAGGNATIFRRPVYEFDVGLHYVGGCHPDGVIPRILRAAGVDDVVFEEMDPDGYDVLVVPGLRLRVPKGIDAWRDRLCEAFPAERRGIDRYASLLRQLQRCLRVWPRAVPTLAAAARSPGILRWGRRSFADVLAHCTDDPTLRAVLAAQHPGYALPPSRASALVGLGIALHYLEGAYYPRGGGQVISDRLAAAIEAAGGDVRLRTKALRILVESGRATGVEVETARDGRRRVRAEAVVSNADLKHTLGSLLGGSADDTGPGRRLTRLARRVEGFEMAPAMGVVYLGLSMDLRAAGHPAANYWIHPERDAERQHEQAARGELPDKPGVFVTIGSLKDPGHAGMAPPGHTNVQAMSVAPSAPAAWGVADTGNGYRRSPAYREAKQRFADALLDVVAPVFPGLRDHIDLLEVSTPLTQTRYTGATDGSAYGIAATPAQFGPKRPGPDTPVAGLYLCGASCRAGHGIHGAARSGLEAAAKLLPRGLLREVLG
jgi:phytoene dehydrogenase-like protein